MEPNIDREINAAETKALQQQNAALLRQNQLLKAELAQIKNMHGHNQTELSVYKKIVLENSSDNQVLEMQHQRIFQLETQLEILQNKYNKMLKSGGSNQMTDFAVKCKQYERKLKEKDTEHQKQISVLRERLMKQSAVQLVQTKRLITSPNGEVKKSSLAVGKFV